MAKATVPEQATLAAHGSSVLPEVAVDSYNEEIRDKDGFIGDRASKRAFQDILDELRTSLRRFDEDPLGDAKTADIPKKALDKALQSGEIDAAALVHSAVEEFAQSLATVIRRFLHLKSWAKTKRIAIGGGFRQGRVGELAIGRAGLLLKADDIDIELVPIAHNPDEAGLIGAVHLVPAWALEGHDAIVAADIGGSNIRVGLVHFDFQKHRARHGNVVKFDIWRHSDEEPSREDAVKRLNGMLERMIAAAKREKLRLAPVIGIGCPGVIDADGSIERGGQNLPGNWESKRFNLPSLVQQAIPSIEGHDSVVVMHNDAVVQGLSQLPRMTDVKRWGCLTIGTGLGNVRFTNREKLE